jgi:hypothetical protein
VKIAVDMVKEKQRAHQPVFMELPLDTTRRGNTRYES